MLIDIPLNMIKSVEIVAKSLIKSQKFSKFRIYDSSIRFLDRFKSNLFKTYCYVDFSNFYNSLYIGKQKSSLRLLFYLYIVDIILIP